MTPQFLTVQFNYIKNTAFLFVITSLIWSNQSQGQITYDTVWASTSELWNAKDIEQTMDGGYIIGANSLVKVSHLGDTTWSKRHFPIGQFTGVDDVLQTPDGGYVYVTTVPSAGKWAITMVRTDQNGDTLYSNTYDNSTDYTVRNVIATSDGGFLISGNKFITVNDYRIHVIKTNSLGAEEWNYTYPTLSWTNYQSLVESSGGGYTILGSDNDVVLFKLNSAGSLQWSNVHGEASLSENVAGLTETSSGGYLYTGTKFHGGSYDYSFYLVKTDPSGDTLWTVIESDLPPPSAIYDAFGFDTYELDNENIVVTGSAACSWNSTVGFNPGIQFVGIFSSQGNAINDTMAICDPSNSGRSISNTSDGGLVVSGGFRIGNSLDPSNLIKFDSLVCVYASNGIDPLIVPTVGGPPIFCPLSSIYLELNSTCIATHQWPDNSNGSFYQANQADTVYVSNTSYYGCTRMDSIVVETFPQPSPPSLSTNTGRDTFCDGDSLIISTSGSWQSYDWMGPSVGPFDTLASLTTSVSGLYSVSCMDSNGCFYSTSNTYSSTPLPTPSIIPVGGDLVSNYTVGNQWYVDGAILPTDTNQIITPTINGVFTVEVTDSLGCSGTSAPFTVNFVGLKERNFDEHVQMIGNVLTTDMEWTLVDASGRVVLRGDAGRHALDVTGMYVVVTEHGAKRFIIEH